MKTLTWAQEQRINWIGEMLDVYGFINRQHIMKKFRVSVPQASADLSLFKRLHANVEYDTTLKFYRKREGHLMPGPISDSYKGPPDDAPYVPSWCYRKGPRVCPCGHHEGYHNDKGQCLLHHKCGCPGLPAHCRTPLEEE